VERRTDRETPRGGDRIGKLKRETRNSQGGRREKTMKNSLGCVILSNGKKGVSYLKRGRN